MLKFYWLIAHKGTSARKKTMMRSDAKYNSSVSMYLRWVVAQYTCDGLMQGDFVTKTPFIKTHRAKANIFRNEKKTNKHIILLSCITATSRRSDMFKIVILIAMKWCQHIVQWNEIIFHWFTGCILRRLIAGIPGQGKSSQFSLGRNSVAHYADFKRPDCTPTLNVV